MGIKFLGLLLLVICTGEAVGSKEILDTYNEDDGVLLWLNLYPRIKTILAEISHKKMSDNQNSLSANLNAMSETQKSLSQSLKVISETQISLSENQKSLSESLQAMRESLHAISYSQNGLSDNLVKMSERQEIQERKLSEIMENTKQNFSKFEERHLEQPQETIEHNANALETLKDIKQEVAEQQNKLSNFTPQYLDNTMEWTTIMRREHGMVGFDRQWTEYKYGFGEVNDEFFIGLEKLHDLTNNGAPQELFIVLKNDNNEKSIARYDHFKIGNETEKYALLELGEYSGDAGDSLRRHKGMSFSTYDQDNDKFVEVNCAHMFQGAWWFHDCFDSYLFGVYPYPNFWRSWYGSRHGLSFAEIKIRPKIIKWE